MGKSYLAVDVYTGVWKRLIVFGYGCVRWLDYVLALREVSGSIFGRGGLKNLCYDRESYDSITLGTISTL